MEGFTYTNIFETKGIEYIFILAFFAILVPFWLLMNRKLKPREIKTSTGYLNVLSLKIPQGLYFSNYHTWAHLGTNGIARIGLDDFLPHITGKVEVNQVKSPGDFVKKGELIAQITKNGNTLRILSPVSGEIKRVNENLANNPEVLLNDPYKQGWLYSVKPTDWKTEINACYIAEEAVNWVTAELERFKDFVSVSANKYLTQSPNIVLQDGGEMVEYPLSELPCEIWSDFQDKFLS